MSVTMFIRHEVRDFDAWERVYEGLREFQRDHGVRNQAVLRSLDDPRQVVVVHVFDSTDAARAFFDHAELKQAMERAGVDRTTISEEYLDAVEAGNLVEGRGLTRRRTSKAPRAPTLLMRHRVAEFDAWKRAYDGIVDLRREHGVRRHRVLRSLTDPNVVVVVATFDTIANARAFPELPELARAMEGAGVDTSSVKAELLDEVLAGDLIDAKAARAR